MTTVLAATRDPCDAFAYIARARNGGRLGDDQIALADLYANHADFGELGWTFDHVFDTSVTVSEALARVARAVVAERVTQGGKLHLVRDLPSTAPIAMFSPRNINAGTFSAHFLPNLRRYATGRFLCVCRFRSAPDADRRRVASRGVRDLVQGGSGGPPAVGGAPAAVSGPGAGARP